MALVPAAAAPPGGGALVPLGGALGEPLEAKLERLRADREAHSRKAIWTKDAHGGPYRKVNAAKGYDPLLQLPDGRDRPAELGYERIKAGPTSNFVGNHMTQGAIDLVQAQLERPAAAAEGAPRLSGPPPTLPRLLAPGEAAAAGAAVSPAPPRPLQRWRWVDGGAAVRVEVPLDQAALGAGATSVRCSFDAGRLEVLLVPGGSGDVAAGGEAGGSSRQPATHRLLLHPLWAAVVPARCRCYPTGLPALTAGSGCSPPPAVEPLACGAGEGGSACGGSDSQAAHAIAFALPQGATQLVLELAKAAPRQEWAALQGERPLALARPPTSTGGPPDLAVLRKAMRQHLGRSGAGAPGAPAAAEPPAAPATPEADAAAGGPLATDAPTDAAATEAALGEAAALAAAGRHADALAACATCQATPGAAAAALAARLHALRARCHAQLGALRQAVAEQTAAIEAARLLGEPAELCRLLLARAALHEQCEQLAPALEDAAEAARLAPGTHVGRHAALAAERLRRSAPRAQ